MSYDLYFYKQKETNLTKAKIANYLTNTLVSKNDNDNQWFFENEDTGVYFSFETNEPDDDPETIEIFESFDNTHFSFNLNFMRPSFFGLEAFEFVDKFINDLGLYILNPQDGFDNPYLPTKDDLYNNWNKTNLNASKDHFNGESLYYPLDRSNEVWEYNFKRKQLQAEIGEDYFVPKIFFFKTLHDSKIVTVAMWPGHIPIVLPKTDYYLLGREYKKLFKKVTDKILISQQQLFDSLGDYFDEYAVTGTKIIRPDKALKISDIFNGLKSGVVFEKFVKAVSPDSIYNATP